MYPELHPQLDVHIYCNSSHDYNMCKSILYKSHVFLLDNQTHLTIPHHNLGGTQFIPYFKIARRRMLKQVMLNTAHRYT